MHRRVTAIPRSDPEAAIDRAMALRDGGQGDDAARLLTTALQVHPHNPRLWQTLGTVHRAREDSDAAVAAFAEAARLTPGNLRALHGIAQASLEGGHPAVEMFDRLHRMVPTDGSLLLGRAAARLAIGDIDMAIAELDQIVSTSPLWLDGQATLARLRWMRGDGVAFVDGYRRQLAVQPMKAGLWIALIDTLTGAERFAEALAAVADARAATEDTVVLQAYAARLASELGDVQSADAGYARLAGQSDIGIVEHHARHLLRRGRPDAAAARITPLLDDIGAGRLWPYLSLAWRMSDDPRAEWLEGDPRLVRTYDLGLSTRELDALGDRLRQLHRVMRDPLGQSVRGGTQTDGPLFAHVAPEIRQLRAAVVDALDRHIAALGPADPAHPTLRYVGKRHRFAGSWSVRLTGTGHHSAHIHPEGWLSSACYIAVSGADAMGPPPAGWLQLGAPPPSLGLVLKPYRRIEPRRGQLVLFPSTMWHGTAPIIAGERLTVAFDVAAIR